MALYFAYGSCMSLEDLQRTVADAKLIGPARLDDYRLAFTRYSRNRRGGVADVIPSEGDYVEGVLFEVPDFESLDRREGAPFSYQQSKVKVILTKDKRPVEATTYMVVNKSAENYKPSREYLKIILDGAKNLSTEYEAKLRAMFSEYYNDL